MPEWIRPYVNDCHINVLELAWLNEEQEKFFKNDMRVVVNYLRQVRENKDYVPDRSVLDHVQATLNLLQAFAPTVDFDRIMKNTVELQEKGERIMLPSPFDLMKQSAIREGLAEGRKEGRNEALEMVKKRLLSRGMPINEIDEILALS
mgnify:CR=1 FL=1